MRLQNILDDLEGLSDAEPLTRREIVRRTLTGIGMGLLALAIEKRRAVTGALFPQVAGGSRAHRVSAEEQERAERGAEVQEETRMYTGLTTPAFHMLIPQGNILDDGATFPLLYSEESGRGTLSFIRMADGLVVEVGQKRFRVRLDLHGEELSLRETKRIAFENGRFVIESTYGTADVMPESVMELIRSLHAANGTVTLPCTFFAKQVKPNPDHPIVRKLIATKRALSFFGMGEDASGETMETPASLMLSFSRSADDSVALQ